MATIIRDMSIHVQSGLQLLGLQTNNILIGKGESFATCKPDGRLLSRVGFSCDKRGTHAYIVDPYGKHKVCVRYSGDLEDFSLRMCKSIIGVSLRHMRTLTI